MFEKAMHSVSLFFIPQEANGFVPYALSGKAMTVYVLVAVLIKAFSLLAGIGIPATKLFADVSSQFVISLTNQERQSQGLPVLAENQILDKAACEKANDMIQNRYFAHDSPSGIDPWHWFTQVGYQYSRAGENLAIDFSQSQDVVNAWMNSPSHRANLLGNYQDVGICVAQGNIEGYTSTLVVQLFGTPKAPLPVRTALPRITPVITPAPAATHIALATPKPSVEGLRTVEPAPTETTASSASLLVGSVDTNTTGLGLSLVKDKPMLFGKAWDTLLNPFWLYAAFLAYLIGIIAVGAFARAYTPSPRALIGMAVVMFVVVGMMSLPSVPDVLHLQARVLAPTMIQAK